MEKKVSIIMGVYNCAPTLREAIDSILKQTYTDWEFVICDDGSKDSSLDILEQYAEKYPDKFVILKNEINQGLNVTLNRCLSVTKGIYVARQDGDDISEPSRLRKEVDFLECHPEYALVSSHMSFFDEGGIWGKWKTPEKPERIDFLRQSPCFCHAACMIRRSAFGEVGGYSVDDRYLRCEDINLWYKLYARGYKGYNIQEPLYMMRDDQNAYNRRTVRNRMNIILTEYDGMRSLHCSFLEYRFFVKKLVKNLLLVVMPAGIYKYLHKRRLNQK